MVAWKEAVQGGESATCRFCCVKICAPDMDTQLPIAIVGGGPAGAFAGERLARGKRTVILFDEKLAWEKPCGGGITHKALTQFPFLAEAESRHNPVAHCELISPAGRRVRFHMQHPVAIFSRFALNELLLERARTAGVELRQERVIQISSADGEWRLTTPRGNTARRTLFWLPGRAILSGPSSGLQFLRTICWSRRDISSPAAIR